MPNSFTCAILRPVTTSAVRLAALGVVLSIVAGAGVAVAGPDDAPTATTILRELGFSLSTSVADKPAISVTRKGVLLATPWGDFEGTIRGRTVRAWSPLADQTTSQSDPGSSHRHYGGR